MSHWRKWGCVLVGVSSVAACGQELAMPQREQKATAGAEQGSAEGITGASGAPSEASAGRLPVLDFPMYTTFAGAGGEADGSGEAGVRTAGGSSPRGGGGNGGGTKSHGGASSVGAGGQAGQGGAAEVIEPPAPATLLFSEYVEGSSTFKALEIFALRGGSLENCELQTFFNGKQEPSRLALHGSLEPGQQQVICSTGNDKAPGLALQHPELCQVATNLGFNGDDALALSCNGVVQDIIGQIGVDPGDSWGLGSTLDHTLQRRCTVTVGRTDNQEPFDVDAQWVIFGIDTFSDLGRRSCDDPPASRVGSR